MKNVQKQVKKYLVIFKKIVTPPYTKKDISIAGLIVALLITPIFVLAISKDTNLFGKAATINSIEPENGVLSGNATVVSDSNASGGEYVKLGNVGTSLTPTPSPLNPITNLHYTSNGNFDVNGNFFFGGGTYDSVLLGTVYGSNIAGIIVKADSEGSIQWKR